MTTRPLTWLVVIAVVAVLPALHPGAAWYLDNPSHLVEVAGLARDVLPNDPWFSGWTDIANAGFAVNQANAPLLWLGLAAVDAAGSTSPLPYLLCIVASNAVFAVGAWRLATRLLEPWPAFVATALAALSTSDLYGNGGAAGGMWPHRLANGLLLWGIASRRRDAASVGAWLAAVLLCHTYSGMAAAALVAGGMVEAAWRRELARCASLATGSALAAVATLPFWYPLLDPSLRPLASAGTRAWWPFDTAAWLLLPMNPVVLGDPLRYWYLGGALGFPVAIALVVGLVAAIRRRPTFADPALAARLGALLAVLLVVVAVVVPLTGTTALGPNPWRHLTLVHLGLCALGGAGLARIAPPRAGVGLGIAGAVLVAAAGAEEMSLPLEDDTAELHAQLRAAWAAVDGLGAPGNVYHQTTNFDIDGPRALYFSEAGAISALTTGRPTLGTWYSVSAVASERHMRSEGHLFMGRPTSRYAEDSEMIGRRLGELRVGAVVTVEPTAADLMAASPAVAPRGAFGPFRVWEVKSPDLARVITPVGPLAVVTDGGGELVADAHVDGPTPFVFRETWHPWWTATLDGDPVPLFAAPTTGMIGGVLPRSGRLTVVWADPTRWTAVPAIVAWAALALLGAQNARQKASSPSTGSPGSRTEMPVR